MSPRQGKMKLCQERCERDVQGRERHGYVERLRGRGNRHGHDQKEGERVFKPAGEKYQRRQLHDVVAQEQCGMAGGQEMRPGIGQG